MKMVTLENLVPGSLIELDHSYDVTLYFANQIFDDYWRTGASSTLENNFIILPYSFYLNANRKPTIATYIEYRNSDTNFIYLKIIYKNKLYWIRMSECKKYYE